jgi:alpha-galactosidase
VKYLKLKLNRYPIIKNIIKMRTQIILYISAVIAITSNAFDNGVGRTPAMGWNTWNKYGCKISDKIITSNVDAIIANGLDKLGYVYVNIDDCWQ